jgi:hypothetical protein
MSGRKILPSWRAEHSSSSFTGLSMVLNVVDVPYGVYSLCSMCNTVSFKVNRCGASISEVGWRVDVADWQTLSKIQMYAIASTEGSIVARP